MLSPAQPSPAQLSGKKMHHFELLFSPKILKDREIMLFQNRKNKIPVVNENHCFLMIFRRKLNVKKSTRRSCNGSKARSLGYLMIFSCFSRASWPIAKPACWFFDAQFGWKIMLFSRVFRVLSDSLRDRGVDFLTVNIDEKSCYFRVFFACFLTDCKTGVLIFSCYAQRRVLVH